MSRLFLLVIDIVFLLESFGLAEVAKWGKFCLFSVG